MGQACSKKRPVAVKDKESPTSSDGALQTKLFLDSCASTPFALDPSLIMNDSCYNQDSSRGAWPTVGWTKAHRLHDIQTLCNVCKTFNMADLTDGGPSVRLRDEFCDMEATAGFCRLCALLTQSYRGIDGAYYQTGFVYMMGHQDALSGPVMVRKRGKQLNFYVPAPEHWGDQASFRWQLGSFETLIDKTAVTGISIPQQVGTPLDGFQISAESHVFILRKELQRTSAGAPWCPTCVPKNIPWAAGDRISAPTNIISPLPHRVIEIISPFTTVESLIQLRLKTTSHTEHALYVTLSHRWGGSFTLKTFKETLPARTRGFTLNDLPRTFQDAVLVSAALGLRYLWIDSLCIVQNDEDEWLDQSTKMGVIYSNSTVTIAAHSAGQCNEGFLWRSRVPSNLHITTCAGGFSLSLPPLSGQQLRRRFFESEITKRAWVLQELTLSPRMLHFVEDHVFWECEHACGVPPNETDHRSGTLTPPPEETSAAIFRTARTMFSTQTAWLQLVQRYSEYRMTKPGDKLVAISGVVDVLQRHGEQEHGSGKLDYHCGVFTSDIEKSLLWFNPADKMLCEDIECCHLERHLERAPSWSWASVDGRFCFSALNVQKNKNEDEPLSMLRAHGFHHQDNGSSSMLDSYCRLTIQAPVIRVESTMDGIRSKWVNPPINLPRFVVGLSHSGNHWTDMYGWFIPDDSSALPVTNPSVLFGTTEPVLLTLVAVRGRVVGGSLIGAYCLVIEAVNGSMDLYRRIGLAYVRLGYSYIKGELLTSQEIVVLV